MSRTRTDAGPTCTLDVDCLTLVFRSERLPYLQYLKRVSTTFRAAARQTLDSEEWLCRRESPQPSSTTWGLNQSAMEAALGRTRDFALPLRLIWGSHACDHNADHPPKGQDSYTYEGPFRLMDCAWSSQVEEDEAVLDERFVRSLGRDATATLEALTVRRKKWKDPSDMPDAALVDGFEIVDIRISVDGVGVFTDALELAPLANLDIMKEWDIDDDHTIEGGGVTAFARVPDALVQRAGKRFQYIRWTPMTRRNDALLMHCDACDTDTSDGLGCWEALPEGLSTTRLKAMSGVTCPLLSNLLHAGTVPRGVTVLPAAPSKKW
jgi:hypothetical protein